MEQFGQLSGEPQTSSERMHRAEALANHYRNALKLIADSDITPEIAKQISDGVSVDRIYENIAYEALQLESV
jgi:hypothetical protein